jgi:hypothetical protein
VPQKEQAGHGHRLRLWTAYENPLSGVLKNQHAAQAENWKCLLPIFIGKFAVTTIPLYLSVGLDVRLGVTRTPHLFPGHPGHPSSPCDLFLWGYVKDEVYMPPLPRDLRELRQRIVAAVDTVDIDMLQRVWQDLDYRIDVCRVTKGGHMEHL